MASGLQRVHSHLLVQGRRRADADNIHLAKARAVIGHGLRLREAVLRDQPLRACQIAVRQDSDNRILREGEIPLDVGGCNAAAADDHHSKHSINSLSFICSKDTQYA